MGHPMPAQHTSVVLRPHFKPAQTLLALAMAAVLALGAGVVILANDADQVASTNRIAPAVQQSQTQLPAGTRFDGGPDEGTRGLAAQSQLPAGTRFDGGPDEGSRGATSYYDLPNPAVQLSAGSRRWHQGSRRWPDHAPAGSWRSLDPQSDIR